jgi:UrcA family protein
MNLPKLLARACVWSRYVLSAVVVGVILIVQIGAAHAAADPGDALKATVQYRYRDLATDAAARALLRRLTVSAEKVCPSLSLGSLSIRVKVARCREEAVRGAVAQIQIPLLARLSRVGDLRQTEQPRYRSLRRAMSADMAAPAGAGR